MWDESGVLDFHLMDGGDIIIIFPFLDPSIGNHTEEHLHFVNCRGFVVLQNGRFVQDVPQVTSLVTTPSDQ